MPINYRTPDGVMRSFLNKDNLNLVLENLKIQDTYYLSNCHHLLFYELAKCFKNVKILELGTGEGSLIITLSIACKEMDGHITTIDINNLSPLIDEKLKTLKVEELKNYMTVIHSNDLDGNVIGETYRNGKYDIIFVDTTKQYLQTLQELIAYSGMVSKRGFIIIHDVENSECMDAIQDFIKDYPQFKIFMERTLGKADFVILKKYD